MHARETLKPLKIRRWTIPVYGTIDHFELVDDEIPPPGPSEVRVAVRAGGLNFADLFATLGLYTAAGRAPLTPGFETSGVVESVGERVEDFSVGDRVVAISRFGGYVTGLNVNVKYVRRLVEGWSFEQGAAFPVQGLTAYYALVVLGGLVPKTWTETRGRMPMSERKAVLIHSAAGGVGLIAGELVQKCEGVVVATIGREEKVAVLKERLGLPRERIVVRGVDKGDFHSLVVDRCLGGSKLDVVLDSVGGEYFDPSWKALGIGGRYVYFGSSSWMPKTNLQGFSLSGLWAWIQLGWKVFHRPKLDVTSTLAENKSLSAFNLIYLWEQTDYTGKLWDELLGLNLSAPLVGRTFDFKEAKKALKFFQSGRSVGKICLVVPEGS